MKHYSVALSRQFEKQIRRIDRSAQKRILKRLYDLEALVGDPRSRCKALTGPLAGLWRLRVGDYRVILDVQDDQLVIIALDVNHRSSIYAK